MSCSDGSLLWACKVGRKNLIWKDEFSEPLLFRGFDGEDDEDKDLDGDLAPHEYHEEELFEDEDDDDDGDNDLHFPEASGPDGKSEIYQCACHLGGNDAGPAVIIFICSNTAHTWVRLSGRDLSHA